MGVYDRLMNRVRLAAEKQVEKTIDEKLPRMVEKAIRRSLAKNDGAELTPLGFSWAWIYAMEDAGWSVDRDRLVRWMRDYLPAPVGADGYGWTATDANNLAASFRLEFGEVE